VEDETLVQTQQPLSVDRPIHAEREACRWTLAQLDTARSLGDPEVDRLVTQILVANDQGGWRGTAVYNHLLELADKLVDTPEIILLKSSEVMRQLQWYPDDFVAYFEPMPVPDWVDTAQLQRASELWCENLLAIIGVLYAASLPACYLMHRGLPALYDTTKLKDPRYISQRLYETGIFLEDVLSPGGIQVMTDIIAVSQDAVRSGTRLRPSTQRYFFGKGYVSAKKVRFLHASMRLMLTHPPSDTENHRHQALTPWDQATHGQPVNQEDLAFTLLTFGYLIPQGLAKWGCHWATEDQEAFWHLWRVVGYIMGIDATLIPQTWAEAEQLFLMIRGQQAGASTQGCSLTASLIHFFQSYLPPGLSTMISPMLIQHQLGSPYDAMVLPPSQLQVTQRLAPRLIFALLLGLLHLYYLIRNHIFHRLPTLAAFMGSVFAQAGEALVQSWRDVYDRRPFEVPPDATDWRPMAGVREEDLLKLTAWRRQLLITIAIGLSLLIGSSLGLGLLLLLWLFDAGSVTELVKWLTVGGFTAAVGVLKLAVPWVSRHRPKLSP
jgi:hypothetical protein